MTDVPAPRFPPAPPALLRDQVLGIHHVALAVADLDEALALWQEMFGLALLLREVIAHQGVEAAALVVPPGADVVVGTAWHPGTELELVAPHGDGSGIARFIERRGAGLHHVAWAVRDVAACLDHLARASARVIDSEPRPGLHGTPVAFVHPSSTGGVLVELVQTSTGGT